MNDPNLVWLRIFDHAGSALAFSAIVVSATYLATRRFAGHRNLILHAGFFCLCRSITHVYLMEAGLKQNQSPNYVAAFLTLSTVAGLTLATHILSSLADIQRTLTDTEAEEMLRQDKRADIAQKEILFESMAESNRQASAQHLISVERFRSQP